MAEETVEEEKSLMLKIAQILNDARTSNATHNRKLKELSALRSKTSSSSLFFSAFCKTLTPVFAFQRRTASAERTVRFISAFATARDSGPASQCDAFLEDFLRFLLPVSAAANRTHRFRACQIVSSVGFLIWLLNQVLEIEGKLGFGVLGLSYFWYFEWLFLGWLLRK